MAQCFELTKYPLKPVRYVQVVRELIAEYDGEHLHSVRTFRELIDSQFLILVLPFAHVLIRRHHRADVVFNDNFLSTFYVKRNGVNGQWLELGLNADLWPARNAHM